jgi:uncharacterized surface protein with fasciclin (FAS1) repeats
MRTKRHWKALLALLAVFTLFAAACGDDDDGGDTASGDQTTTTAAPDDDMGDTTMADEGGEMLEPVGEACGEIPSDGEGSSAGMADDPTATAASNNPLLSTLVAAVGAADLGDTLNDTSAEYTVFAPFNGAFEKLDPEVVEGLTTDPAQKDALTDILTYHVYAGGKMDIDQLAEAGTLEMVNGDSVEIEKSGDTLEVNGESMVICGNVTTANATVHIIDTVLMPPS